MKQTLIITVGYPGSGKSPLSKEIANKFKISRINGDDIRVFLKDNISYFNDIKVNEYETPKAKSFYKLSQSIRKQLLENLFENNQSVIIDGGNHQIIKRENWIKFTRENYPDTRIVIIYVKIDEKTLLERLDKRDKKEGAKWRENYEKRWSKTFEEPTLDEADYLLVYDQDNKDEILEEVRELFNQ